MKEGRERINPRRFILTYGVAVNTGLDTGSEAMRRCDGPMQDLKALYT